MTHRIVPYVFSAGLGCTECGNYLSVGPVVVSATGQKVCGRCPKPVHAIESLFNLVAQQCKFRCINSYSGCLQLLSYTETSEHEKICKYRKFYNCEYCDYHGSLWKIICHSARLHLNFRIFLNRNDVLQQKFKSIIKPLLKMNADRLIKLVNNGPRLFCICVTCKKQFTDATVVYVCDEYHLACSNCLKGCPKCKTPSIWDKKTDLHKILLKCEWPGCTQKSNIFHYAYHKQKCHYRQFKCSSPQCEYVGSLQTLKKHWHLNPLLNSNIVNLEQSSVYYCYIGCANEIISIAFDEHATGGIISIDTENVVSPFSFKFQIGRRNAAVVEFAKMWEYKASGHTKYITFTGNGVKLTLSFITNTC